MADAPPGSSDTVPGRAAGATPLRDAFLLACCAAATVMLLAVLGWYAGDGLGLDDESYYLLWMAHPGEFPESLTQFGFVYHPLYELVRGNLHVLRVTNILLTFGLATWLTHLFLRVVLRTDGAGRRETAIASAGIATASLTLFSASAGTPGYYSLNLQGLMLAAIGLMLIERKDASSGKRLAAAALAGVALEVVFLAKPTTFAVATLMVVAYALARRPMRIRELVVGLAAGLAALVASALAIDGSLPGFVDRLRTEADLQRVLESGHTIGNALRIDPIPYLDLRGLLLATTWTVVVTLVLLAVRRGGSVALAASIAAGCASVAVTAAAGFVHVGDVSGLQDGIYLLPVVAFALVAAVVAMLRASLPRVVTWRDVLLVAGLAVTPLAFAFGSNVNNWHIASGASIFYVLAGLAAARTLPDADARRAVAIVAAVVTVIATAQSTARFRGRLLPAPGVQGRVVATRVPGGTVRIPAPRHDYVVAAIAMADDAGFRPGTPMIDLTGLSPGLMYVVRARPLARPWTPGGRPGSDRFAVRLWRLADCEDVARAWVIDEPDGPKRLSPASLATVGIDLERDLRAVGTVNRPPRQVLLRPTRPPDDAADACEHARSNAAAR